MRKGLQESPLLLTSTAHGPWCDQLYNARLLWVIQQHVILFEFRRNSITTNLISHVYSRVRSLLLFRQREAQPSTGADVRERTPAPAPREIFPPSDVAQFDYPGHPETIGSTESAPVRQPSTESGVDGEQLKTK